LNETSYILAKEKEDQLAIKQIICGVWWQCAMLWWLIFAFNILLRKHAKKYSRYVYGIPKKKSIQL